MALDKIRKCILCFWAFEAAVIYYFSCIQPHPFFTENPILEFFEWNRPIISKDQACTWDDFESSRIETVSTAITDDTEPPQLHLLSHVHRPGPLIKFVAGAPSCSEKTDGPCFKRVWWRNWGVPRPANIATLFECLLWMNVIPVATNDDHEKSQKKLQKMIVGGKWQQTKEPRTIFLCLVYATSACTSIIVCTISKKSIVHFHLLSVLA